MSWDKAAEAIIREAMERGEFDHLPGQGKPIDLNAYFETPEELREIFENLERGKPLTMDAAHLALQTLDSTATKVLTACALDGDHAPSLTQDKVPYSKVLNTLNLLFDRYGYDYGAGRFAGDLSAPIRSTCELHGAMLPQSYTGLPQVTVPAGFVGGRYPMGISFLGRLWDDRRLLEIAERCPVHQTLQGKIQVNTRLG